MTGEAPSPLQFAAFAETLRRQEFARLAEAVTPPIEGVLVISVPKVTLSNPLR